jgi:TolB-like protein
MKNLFRITLMTLTLTATSIKVKSQDKAAVVNVYTDGVKITPSGAESLLRIELTKTEQFKVFDKQDMVEIAKDNQINFNDCYGKKCLHNIGALAEVDKIVTGSIENLGKKIVVTVKILDVKTDSYDQIAIQEFINIETEVQNMVQITLNKALGLENNKAAMETLVYFNQPPKTPTVQISNSGPRMGLAMVGGDIAEVLTRPESEGGYDAIPVLSQFGYQFEQVYLSSGNFQALAEGMILMTGLEQGLFNPSFAFMNGFRNSKTGIEVAFGPSIKLKREASGYFDAENGNTWRLENEYDPSAEITDSNGVTYTDYNANPNPNILETRLDRRGQVKLAATWVWAVGKTFHSGYLNIPVNAYFSYGKDGWFTGLSVGFNIAKKD